MAHDYTTQQGDTADLIALDHFGRTRGATEAILRANPGLAAAGTVLPEGLPVVIPTVAPEPAQPVIRLWGTAS